MTNYNHGKNRPSLRKLIYYPSNQSRVMQNKTPSPQHFLLPRFNFTPKFSTCPRRQRGTGNGGCGQLFTQFLPSFLLRTGPHKLLSVGSFPRVHPSGAECSSVAPHGCKEGGDRIAPYGPPWAPQGQPSMGCSHCSLSLRDCSYSAAQAASNQHLALAVQTQAVPLFSPGMLWCIKALPSEIFQWMD